MLNNTQLFSKIYGGLLGSAVGDALGGPVEGMSYTEIEKEFGVVKTMLPYPDEPAEHAQFTNDPGSYTDDTRLALIICKAIFEAKGQPERGDLAKVLVDYHYNHTGQLQRSFIEEYYLKGIYGSRKLIYGGQPTNGSIMAIAPVGLIHPANPKAAFAMAYELSFVTHGYAKESAAMAAAAIAEAMRPGATVKQIIEVTLATAAWYRREGELWPITIRERAWARFEGRPNDVLIARALEVVDRHKDVLAIRAELYDLLYVSPVGSEAGQTLAVALAMLAAAEGDFQETVIGAVNYGRDCDSYATVAGAIAGAMHGAGAIPADWSEAVLRANPEPNLRDVSLELTNVVEALHREREGAVKAVNALLD